MPDKTSPPTSYPQINLALQHLHKGVQLVLEEKMVGLYLYGSLASGDFNLQTSDIDFLVVTAGVLPKDTVAALETFHRKLGYTEPKWAPKLEGSYLALEALPRYAPEDTRAWPTLNEGQFYLAPHGWDWVLQRHILREQGIALSGPGLRRLIEPVGPDDLRRAVGELLNEWWAPMLEDPTRLQSSAYQAYAVLSMCRSLYTLRFGEIVSKPQAAVWAINALGDRWTDLIREALAWRPGKEFRDKDRVMELIQLTVGGKLKAADLW